MAATGRPPMPQKVRQLRGETRPSRTRVEPQPAERVPEPPKWLTLEARAVWDRQIGELEAMGLLFAVDGDLLALYASSMAMFDEAERVLAAEGCVVDDGEHPGRRKRNPWLLVRRDAFNEIARLASAFGMSPQARAHLATPVRGLADGSREAAARLLS